MKSMQFNVFSLIITKYHVIFYKLWSVKKTIDLILNKHSFDAYQPDLLTQPEFFCMEILHSCYSN